MALPIKKLYIDTKYKSRDSVSNSNFKIDLPTTLSFPDNSVFYIDDISIPHSWFTIEKDVNDKLYAVIIEAGQATDYKIAVLSAGVYNGTELATEIQLKLGINAIYNSKRNNLDIYTYDANKQYEIMTNEDIYTKLNNHWGGVNYDPINSQNCNDIIGNNINFNSPMYNASNMYSGAVNLQPIRNIYIHSSLGNYNTLGPRGETSIVKKVPVTANSGDYIFDQVLTGNDFGDCSKQTLRNISFELKDVHGNNIPMHGNHLSFSVIFSRMNPEM